MSELHDHLNQLAARGTERGADAVLAAAVAAADEEVDVQPVSLSDDASSRPVRKGRSAFAAGGIAAMLGVATLAISALVGGSGADSPEAAVRQLADAISHEDPLAAVDVLAPEEVRTLRDTVDLASKKAAEVELVNAAGAPLAGVDLSLEGLDLTTEELAPGFTKVYVRGGTFTAHTDRAGLSPLLQKATQDGDEADASADFASVRPFDTDPFVVAVERDGSWYVSAGYTILEYIRVSAGASPADYGSAQASVASLGAGSPEAAAEDMLQAVGQGDWLRVLELVPPDEIPVYDYRDLILAEAAEDSSSPEWTVEEFEATSTIEGDTALVTVSAAVSDPDGNSFRFADDCATSSFAVYDADERIDSCVSALSFVPFYGGGPSVARDEPDVQVTAVQRDGRWFLSPVGTALDYLDLAVEKIDRRWMYTVLGLARELDPDGPLALGHANPAPDGVGVYELAGRAGQGVIGRYEGECCPISVQVYTPDGSFLEESWGLFEGRELRLPVDGTYKVVVYSYGAATSYTLWDSADAPAEAFESPYDFPGEFPDEFPREECEVTIGGGGECTSVSFGSDSGVVTPTTFGP